MHLSCFHDLQIRRGKGRSRGRDTSGGQLAPKTVGLPCCLPNGEEGSRPIRPRPIIIQNLRINTNIQHLPFAMGQRGGKSMRAHHMR
jgi:hypothetical protein